MTPDVPRSTRDLLREHRVFTGIVLVAIALRIAAVLPVHFSAFSSDEGEFIYLGHRLADGQEFIDSNAERSVRAPLYPLLLAASFKVIGAGLTFPYILSALAGGIGAGCVYLLALRILRDQRAAFFAGIGAAVYPGLVIAGALLHTEALYIVFFLLVILLAYRIIDGKGVPDAAALGILAGVAALTRAVFVGFFPILLAVLWWMRKKSGRPAILPVVVALAMFAAVLTPWTVRNYEVHGAFVPVSTFGWSSFLIGNNPFVHGTPELGRGFDAWFEQEALNHGINDVHKLAELPRTLLNRDVALDYIGTHPAHCFTLLAEKAYVFWVYPIAHSATYSPVQALGVGADFLLLLGVTFGIVSTWNLRARLLPIYAAVVFFTLVHVVLHAEARYRLPLIPLICILFGAGIALCADREAFRRAMSGRRARQAATLGIGVILVVYVFTGILFLTGRV